MTKTRSIIIIITCYVRQVYFAQKLLYIPIKVAGNGAKTRLLTPPIILCITKH